MHHGTQGKGNDSLRGKKIEMKKVILLCFFSSFAFAQSQAPLGQVEDYAAQQNAIITITRHGRFVWLEMSGSEVWNGENCGRGSR